MNVDVEYCRHQLIKLDPKINYLIHYFDCPRFLGFTKRDTNIVNDVVRAPIALLKQLYTELETPTDNLYRYFKLAFKYGSLSNYYSKNTTIERIKSDLACYHLCIFFMELSEQLFNFCKYASIIVNSKSPE